MLSKMPPKLSDSLQTITFSEGDGVYSSDITSTDVVVSTTAGSHHHGSSMMKLRNVVDYTWEPKYYSGQLLALHKSGNYLAYSMKSANTLQPIISGLVRVVYNPEPNTRVLIKGMKGQIQDLAFGHFDQVVLACIDVLGNFYIHQIDTNENGLTCTLLLEVREDTGIGGLNHKVVWCPYIPDEDEDMDDDVAWLLVTIHANTARLWNLGMARREATNNCLSASKALITYGVIRVAPAPGTLLTARLAPDGTALAIASEDGRVLFYQISNDGTLRCLHTWTPHDGEPLSCLFFLDNYNTITSDDQFWKYAVTGSKNNSVLKIWSCKTWTCHQTITFAPNINADTNLTGMKVQVDSSARHLMVSDLQSRCLYIMQLRPEGDVCTSICEFTLSSPVLSFIHVSDEIMPKCDSTCNNLYHSNGAGSEHGISPTEFDLHGNDSPTGTSPSTLIRLTMFVVQPKSLQEAIFTYSLPEPPCECNTSLDSETITGMTSSILQQQTQQLKMLLLKSQTQPGSLMAQRPESPPTLNLMTPDAFSVPSSSPGKREEEDPPLSATPDVTPSNQRPELNNTNTEIAKIFMDQTQKEQKPTSAGSSPSREVQEIMSLTDNDFYQEVTVPIDNEELEETFNGDFVPPDFPADPMDLPVPPANTEISWPQISIAQINEANLRKASSDKSGSHPLNLSTLQDSLNSTQDAIVDKTAGLCEHDGKKLEVLEQKLDALTDLISQQNCEIRTLRSELYDPRQVIEQALESHTARTTVAIETALTDGWERISACGEMAGRAAAQAAGVGAAHALQPLVQGLQTKLAQKLTATDHLLRENLEKLLSNETVLDKLSASVSTALAEMVQVWFRDAVTSSVLPAMERTHHGLFKQLNQTFQQGAKDFAANTEALARAAAERGGASAAAALRMALDKHTEALTAATSHSQVSAVIADAAKTVLEKELVWWRQEARAVVTDLSRAHSPVTPSAKDRQMQVTQIQSLLQSGDLNGAFQLALSAADLSLVMCACRGADPGRVFGPPCVLRQHVLLSLVQQLAADMTHDTQLKHRYLEEAILNMDTSNPVTREHLPVVVRELKKQVTSFLTSSPSHPLARQLRMLNMAADSLLNSL